MADILIVEDDRRINELIRRTLTMTGHIGLPAYSGREALAVLEEKRIDLILLDIGLPDMDGFALMRQIAREYAVIPVICVTARDEVPDRVKGLRGGAEDYIVKPFDLYELGARVAAHLRREQRRQENSAVRFFGELTVDYTGRTVSVNGEQVSLSKREFDILELLSVNAGQVFDRERIYEIVWGIDGDGSSDTIMEHIRKIRAKLAVYTLHSFIETVWGCGYRWNG